MDEQNRAGKNKEGNREAEYQPAANENRRGGRNQHRGSSPRPMPPLQQNVPKSSLNMNELRELAELINEHGFTDFEFENENIRVRLRKELAQQIVQAAPQTITTAPAAAPTPSAAPATQTVQTPNNTANVASAPATDEDANLKKIVSPIVGTFYRAPSPEANHFVEIGSQVSSETIVCIVEAMKLMNEIPAEISGEIIKIYVENGQPVEYGQPLFAVK